VQLPLERIEIGKGIAHSRDLQPPRHVEALRAVVHAVGRHMDEHRAEREAIGRAAERDIDCGVESALAGACGAGREAGFRIVEQRAQLPGASSRSILDRCPHGLRRAIDAIGPSQHRAHDVRERVVQRARADVEAPVPLRVIELLADAEQFIRGPGVVREEDVEGVAHRFQTRPWTNSTELRAGSRT
jgi:hypothetical protein